MIFISQALVGDAGSFAELHGLCFDRGWSVDDFQKFLADDMVLAFKAEMENRLYSFVLARRVADEAELLTICTAADVRRQGFGAVLISRLIDELRSSGGRQLFLEVAEDNVAAIRLYEGLGFEMYGRRPRYYRSSDGTTFTDCLNYRLNLPAS